MSEERNFDQYVRSELSDLSSPVSPHIWENIIAAREKRKPVGFWVNTLNAKNVLIAAGLLVSVVAASLLFLNKDEKNTIKENKQIANINNKSVEVNTIAGNNNEVKNDPSAQKNIESVPVVSLSKNNFNVGDNATQQVVHKRDAVKRSAIFDGAKTQTKTDEDIITTETTEADKTAESHLSTITTSIKNNLLERPEMQPQSIFSATASETFLRERQFPNIKLPGCPTVEEQAAANKKYIEIYAGPDFTLRNFKDTSASVYLQKRKTSTQVSSAYSAGIRYTKVFKNGMSVKLGFNYSQVNEKFTFIQSNLSQVTYVIDPVSGDTTGSYTISGTRKKTTYNKYRTVDIPLLIGYELGNGRLHVNVNVGAMVNIYSWQKGEVLDTSLQPVVITTGKSNSSLYQFKNNVGLGLTGGIGVYYKLTDKLHLMAEPYIRYNLQPMSKSDLTLQQKYNTIGLHVGVRLDLE